MKRTIVSAVEQHGKNAMTSMKDSEEEFNKTTKELCLVDEASDLKDTELEILGSEDTIKKEIDTLQNTKLQDLSGKFRKGVN